MKTARLLFLFALPFALNAGEVRIGDNSDQVRTSLGSPRGRAQMGQLELWAYDRGEVELHTNRVTRIALRSEEAQAAFDSKRAAAESRVRAEQEIRRLKLAAKGEALKATKLADSSFQRAPARQQMEFWRNFATYYPNVSCAEQLSFARAQCYAEEKAERLQAEETLRLAEVKAKESGAQTFYPIQTGYAYDYNRNDRTTRRLDREYYERVTRSGRDRNTADRRDGCASGNESGRRDFPTNAVTNNNSLLAAGQDVMAWDGTKLPGGEAAGFFR